MNAEGLRLENVLLDPLSPNLSIFVMTPFRCAVEGWQAQGHNRTIGVTYGAIFALAAGGLWRISFSLVGTGLWRISFSLLGTRALAD